MSIRTMLLVGLALCVVAAMPVMAAEKASKGAAKSSEPKAPPVESPPDKMVGDYVGTLNTGGKDVAAEANVVREDPSYRIVLRAPAAGEKFAWVDLPGKGDASKVTFSGGDDAWTGTIENGQLKAESKAGKVDLKFTVKKSPTELQKPPAGAVVLLAYEEGKKSDTAAWTQLKGEPCQWVAMDDGSIQVKGGDIKSKQTFGDFQMHAEFRIPFEPTGKGQGRGNSGIFLHDVYEMQVLDSYGIKPEAHQCGAIYPQTAPLVNACFPPGSWQTYEFTFRAPRFDADGKKIKDATVTTVQNGVKVQENTDIKAPTGSAKSRPEVKAGPIRLQDHQHPVRFRNIWIVELKDEAK